MVGGLRMGDGRREAVPRVTEVTPKYRSDGACEGTLNADGRWQKIGGLFRKRVRLAPDTIGQE